MEFRGPIALTPIQFSCRSPIFFFSGFQKPAVYYYADMTMRLSEIDQALIRYGDTMSLNALSFKIGGVLTPSQCGARLSQLLDAPDWMTAAQQDQMITMKMRIVIVELEEMTRTSRNAEIIIRALEALGNRLDKRAQATEKDLSQLYAFQGTILLDAVSSALEHMKTKLTDGAKLTADEWDNALESALRFAQMELAKHEIRSEPEEIILIEEETDSSTLAIGNTHA